MSDDVWTIKAALDWTQGYLERKGDENPRLSAEWLLCEACGMRRVELYISFERPLSLEERDVLRGYVTRRGQGEPLQYITGEVAFRHIAVKVRRGVLIPRPETEVLVSEALALLPPAARRVARDSQIDAWKGDVLRAAAEAIDEAQSTGEGERGQGAGGAGANDELASVREACAEAVASAGADEGGEAPASAQRPLLVADLCTGSGCIACSIAYERPDARVIATDLSPEAVALARENASALGLSDRVRVEECDLGAGVPEAAMGRLDLVVSNPPYIPSAVMAEIPEEVTAFEPALALDGGADGLELFRREIEWCSRALRPGGGCAFELHETCLDAAADLARSIDFADVRIVRDLAGKPRVLTARKVGAPARDVGDKGTPLMSPHRLLVLPSC